MKMDSLCATLNQSAEVFVGSSSRIKLFDLGETLDQITTHLHLIFYALTEIYLFLRLSTIN